MSNRKKRKNKGRYPYLILTEHNKNEIAEFLGEDIIKYNVYLASAKAQGYKGVRLGPFPEVIVNNSKFLDIQYLEAKNESLQET